MRVHELAKVLNLTSKDLLVKLKTMRIEAKFASSTLDADAINRARKALAKPAPAKKPPAAAAKPAPARPLPAAKKPAAKPALSPKPLVGGPAPKPAAATRPSPAP